MMKSRKTSWVLYFLVIAAFELGLMVYLILARRMVIGHDGFELFVHQWFFINSIISHHEFPLWSPYLNNGTPVWWYFIYSRMDMFSNALMLFAQWIKGSNFLGFFYGSLFFDKFILLCGVWLLSRRYFGNPVTVFFVAGTVMATTVTYTQNSFCLVMFYSIPLIIYLVHRFFDTFNWMWLFLAAYFFCTVSINVYYFVSIITLAVFLYFLTAACISRGEIFKGFKVQAKDISWICGIILILLILGAIYVLGHDPSIYINTTRREQDGGVPLGVFLSYGGDISLFKWLELFLGMSLRMDYTLYMGFLSVPLVVIGILFSKNTHKYIFLWGALFFLLFSCATPVSVLAYFIWPLMKAFRHIAYVSPLIKLYLCFLAGFGFESLFDPHQDQQKKNIFRMSMLASGILLVNTIFLCQLVIKPSLAHYIIGHLGSPLIQNKVTPEYISDYFFTMAVLSLLLALIVFFRPFIKFPKYASSYLIILLSFHMVIINWYALQQAQLRTFPLTGQLYHLMDFGKIPFVAHRIEGQELNSNPREGIMGDMQGTIRNSVDNFTFSDRINTKEKSDFSLKPHQQLFSSFAGQGQSSVLLKLAGVSQDKIQFFSKAYAVGSDQRVASSLLDKKYAGDMLFYRSSSQEKVFPPDDLKGLDLSQNQRLTIPYKVLAFSPNQIVISARTAQSGVWMQYSDTWYPSWKAQINGHQQEVYTASLAYKALPLQKGENIIRFYLESKPVEWLYGFFTASSLVWAVLLVCLVAVGI